MKLLTWILLVIYFALTDSAPTNEQPSNNLNFTNDLSNGMYHVLEAYKPIKMGNLTKNDIEIIKKFYNQTSNGILYNVTVNFDTLSFFFPWKIKIPSNENDTFKMLGRVPSVFVEGYSRDSNHHIVTEKITLDYVIQVTAQYEINMDYPNFDHDKIKLLVGDYQYKPNDETKIKKEIETQIKARFHELFVEEEIGKVGMILIRYMTLMVLEKIFLIYNKQDRYYFIGTIPSTNYTLSNVTIYGLWNIRSISTNHSNLAAHPEIEMGPVRGCLVQNFPSTSEELSFKADNLYISLDRNAAKVNVKTKAYLVVNTKQNVTLTDDQSKFIIEEIESAFAASLKSPLENPKQ